MAIKNKYDFNKIRLYCKKRFVVKDRRLACKPCRFANGKYCLLQHKVKPFRRKGEMFNGSAVPFSKHWNVIAYIKYIIDSGKE